MKILVTHPGKIGDLLWACPTVRLIAERYGDDGKVTLMVPPYLAGVGELLLLQPYIEDVVVDKYWEVRDTAPATPRLPSSGYSIGYDRCYHLGYQDWPKDQLARYVYDCARVEGELNPLDLGRAWITAPTAKEAEDPSPESELGEVSVGFTDEWGELKAGILLSVAASSSDYCDYELLCQVGGRWEKEFGAGLPENVHVWPGGWVEAAYIISRSKVFLGCLSSQAVLAAALGKPRVLVEPNPHRHHEIFQHWDTPLVVGNDWKPTFDARHVADALREKLGKVRGGG